MMQQRIHVNIRNKMHSLLWYTMKPHHFWFVHVASIEGREHTLKNASSPLQGDCDFG